jgi:hypothetical protein
VCRPLVALCAVALLVIGVACGGGGGSKNNNTPSPTNIVSPGSTVSATATLEPNASPGVNPLTDDVIDLAVQLKVMTREQATCVFSNGIILQEFLGATGFNKSTSLDETKVKQEFHDLVQKNAVQLDRCFNSAGG